MRTYHIWWTSSHKHVCWWAFNYDGISSHRIHNIYTHQNPRVTYSRFAHILRVAQFNIAQTIRTQRALNKYPRLVGRIWICCVWCGDIFIKPQITKYQTIGRIWNHHSVLHHFSSRSDVCPFLRVRKLIRYTPRFNINIFHFHPNIRRNLNT